MKKVIPIVILLFLAIKIYSQVFAPIGANWYYNKQVLVDYPAHGYEVYTVVKDTIIDNFDSRKIEISRYSFTNMLTYSGIIYVREEDGKVYFLEDNHFKLTYDFSLSLGDTLSIEVGSTCESNTPVIIDSITKIIIEGETLDVQHFSFNYEFDNHTFTFSDSIIERIGSVRSFKYKPECDDHWGNNLIRCYSDNKLFYKSAWFEQKYPNAQCDTTIDGSINVFDIEADSRIQVYPNPFTRSIKIQSNTGEISNIIIYNEMGQQVLTYFLNYQSIEIDFYGFIPGIYFLLIETKEAFFMKKIIKTNSL